MTATEERKLEGLIDVLDYYRPLHFFQNEDAPSEVLAQRFRETHPGLFERNDPNESSWDPVWLIRDKERVWHDDTEIVDPHGTTYEEVLQRWGEVSRGAFVPVDVIESWESWREPLEPDGHVGWEDYNLEVTFRFAGERYVLRPSVSDWLDYERILRAVNELIADTGFLYHEWDTDDQWACVVVLTDEERRQIERDRGVRFEPITEA